MHTNTYKFAHTHTHTYMYKHASVARFLEWRADLRSDGGDFSEQESSFKDVP